jgi:hypothetical protein
VTRKWRALVRTKGTHCPKMKTCARTSEARSSSSTCQSWSAHGNNVTTWTWHAMHGHGTWPMATWSAQWRARAMRARAACEWTARSLCLLSLCHCLGARERVRTWKAARTLDGNNPSEPPRTSTINQHNTLYLHRVRTLRPHAASERRVRMPRAGHATSSRPVWARTSVEEFEGAWRSTFGPRGRERTIARTGARRRATTNSWRSPPGAARGACPAAAQQRGCWSLRRRPP